MHLKWSDENLELVDVVLHWTPNHWRAGYSCAIMAWGTVQYILLSQTTFHYIFNEQMIKTKSICFFLQYIYSPWLHNWNCVVVDVHTPPLPSNLLKKRTRCSRCRTLRDARHHPNTDESSKTFEIKMFGEFCFLHENEWKCETTREPKRDSEKQSRIWKDLLESWCTAERLGQNGIIWQALDRSHSVWLGH